MKHERRLDMESRKLFHIQKINAWESRLGHSAIVLQGRKETGVQPLFMSREFLENGSGIQEGIREYRFAVSPDRIPSLLGLDLVSCSNTNLSGHTL